jgi:hypothetical protein
MGLAIEAEQHAGLRAIDSELRHLVVGILVVVQAIQEKEGAESTKAWIRV